MEIEPEIIEPAGQRRRPSIQYPPKWKLVTFGVLALIVGAGLLFFMFWAALFFAALGAVSLCINMIIRWLKGDKSPKSNGSTSVRFYIGQKPPGR